VNPRAASPHEAPSPRASLALPEGGERNGDPAAHFLSASDDLLSISGTDGRLKWVNPAHERVTGWSQQELIGRAYFDFVHPADRDRVIESATRLSSTGRSVEIETRLECKDGSYRWLLLTATPASEQGLVYNVAKDITERRETLEKSVRFMELSLDLLCILDFDGCWRQVNPAVERSLGWLSEELVDRRYLDLVHPDDRERVAAESQKLTLPGTETRGFRARLRAKDGSYRAFLWSATSATDEGLIYAVGRDESEQKEAEEVVLEAEERFRGAFDQAPIGMALVSIEKEGAGCFLRVNDALCDITGYSLDELVGMDFHQIAHPEDYDPDMHYVPWMLVGEITQYEVEKRLRHADGRMIWAQVTTSLVRDGQQRPLYLISQIQDITERKQAEQELLESREELQSIIDNTPAVIYMKDREGRFQLVNRRFEMLYDLRREEVVGKSSHDLFPPDVAEQLRNDDLAVLQSAISLEREEVIPRGDGPRTFISTKFPLFDPNSAARTPYAVCAIATDITERKRAEEALKASEHHFREIVDTAHDAFISMDTAGVITAWNPEAEKTFGWSEREAVGRTIATTIIPVRYREAHYRGLEQFLDTGRGQLLNRRVEIEAVHREGYEFPIEMTVSPMRVGGEYTFNAFLHDIRDRRAAEEQIRQLASIVESSGDAIVSTSADAIITSWNRGAEIQYGYSATDAIGRPISMLAGAEAALEERKLFAEALAGREVTQFETEGVRKDGSLVDVWVTISPVRNAVGNVVGVSYISRDITERKRAERALRELQEGFRTAFEDAPIGVALVSVERGSTSRLLQLNRSLCEMTGYTMHELLTMTLGEITDPEDLEAEKHLNQELLAGEIPNYQVEKRLQRKDGIAIWVMHNASTVHDSSGKLLYEIAQIEDISERKRAEEELESAHAEVEERASELERSNADLQQFAYAASHDLSEPLRMVSSYVQLLAKRYVGKLDDDADEFIHYAVDGVVRMQALIDGLLMYSRAGTSEYELAPVDCSEVVETTLTMMKTTVEETGAEVVVDPLPTVDGDEPQLSQLFQNLIGNAIKFVEDGIPHVHVSSERQGREWVFSVADNGIGIDPAHVERVFAVFQRLHGRGEYPGSGIGLAICKRIVERHHGRIWIEARPEGGSIFYFTIPVSAPGSDNPQ
jgi:PAS domain S-box-containing protein